MKAIPIIMQLFTFSVFISEGGPECYKSQEDGIRECFEDLSRTYVPSGKTPSFQDFAGADCDDLDELKDCVVAKLEQCENTTPGNLAESMFKIIKQECMGKPVDLV